jgi:FlaA1/EpsC-like NDP-sugar epimerase
MELNACEAFENNVLGTKTVAEVSGKHKVKAFVLISTDKAVNPTSIMGSTKNLAEKATLITSKQYPDTKFTAVRFGNVLGSRGSVIQVWEKQIASGQAITVTDKEAIRYFMTIPEASQLVIQASAKAHTGEVMLLDMGEPVKIVDLARQMIRLAGLKPDEDIKITYTGLRAGEKLYEELFYGEEAPTPTAQAGVMLSAPRRVAYVEVDNYLRKLLKAVERHDTHNLLQSIRLLVPEYLG